VKKLYIDQTDAEKKATLAEEKQQREAMFVDLIQNAPQRAQEATQAQIAEVAAQAAEKETLFKAAVLESYCAANGSELGFNEVWPTLRTQIVAQKTIANVGNKSASPDPITRFIEQVNLR
jgi:hypothetical protein